MSFSHRCTLSNEDQIIEALNKQSDQILELMEVIDRLMTVVANSMDRIEMLERMALQNTK